MIERRSAVRAGLRPARAPRPGRALAALLFTLLGAGVVSAEDAVLARSRSAREGVLRKLEATRPFLRGMTVSCAGNGREWGTEMMTGALRELEPLGVEWISIHPYARIERSGEVRFKKAADSPYLAAAVQRVAAEKVGLFWLPHLAYWGSFEWRGAIEFGQDQAAWRRFFDGYRDFIVDQAIFAEQHGVRLFAVGIEYDATLEHEAEWRRILAAVRAVYSGVVVYAANWDRVAAVPFWDAVDVIGVQAYFPLGAEPYPSREAIEKGWQQPLAQLRELSGRFGKPVLFTEIGYDLAAQAAREPWLPATADTPENRALRRRLIEAALAGLEKEPFLLGLFWWKWIPGRPAHDPDFKMEDGDARELLARYWAGR